MFDRENDKRIPKGSPVMYDMPTKTYDIDGTRTAPYNIDETIIANRKSSVGVSSVRMSECRRETRGGNLKRVAIASILALSMATSLGLGVTMVADAKEQGYEFNSSISSELSIGKEEIEAMIDHSIAFDNIHYNEDGSYWYDTDGMVQGVINSDDPEMALFSLYSDLREQYLPMTTMDKVFTEANEALSFSGAESYVNYLDDLDGQVFGALNGTGVSYDNYMKCMGKHIVEKNHIDNMVNESRNQNNQNNLDQSTK